MRSYAIRCCALSLSAFCLAAFIPAAYAEPAEATNSLALGISSNPFTAVLLAFALASAVALGAIQFLYLGRFKALRAERDALAAALDGRDAALQMPYVGVIGLITDNMSGDESVLRYVSPSVCTLLRADAERLQTIDDIAGYLAEGSGVTLGSAVRALMAEGKAFSFVAEIRNGSRALKISGIPVEVGTGASPRAALAMVDISEEVQSRAAAEEETRSRRRGTRICSPRSICRPLHSGGATKTCTSALRISRRISSILIRNRRGIPRGAPVGLGHPIRKAGLSWLTANAGCSR